MLPLRIIPPEAAPLTFLCLGAHCDDIEIGCGGSVMRLAAEHPESIFHWVVFSSNAERENEARESAAAFLEKAGERHVEVNEFRESFFPYVGAEIKDRFEKLKSRVDPDLVLTHTREDLHQDHRLISELTWNTFRNHLILEYEIPKYDGDLGAPNSFVPLPRELARRKVDLLLEHFKSQANRDWFSADTFWAMLRIRGIECNASEGFAEAFYARKLTL
jgi:LmbE family N-acetylglucosaminyl deacetylase